VVLFVATVIVFEIKNYIILAAYPGLVLWMFVSFQNKFFSGALRYLFGPILLVLGVGFVLFLFQNMSSSFAEISTDTLLHKAEGFQSWHTQIQEQSGGSGYSLGDFDYSVVGILKKAPQALFITLFGPFPWEIRNFVMLISGLEGLFILYLSLRVLFSPSSLLRIRNVFSEPILLFCLSFTIVLGIAVGITSFNYGALVRYKIPLVPFYIAFLVILEPTKAQKKKR
jgi:hypothetical protein